MTEKELVDKYGHLFSLIDYSKLTWQQKLIRYIKNKLFWKFRR